jgi:hypothetical protein
MKRPAFQFYPSDWLRDTALRSCSASARGLWIDMICFMHEGYPYGHLKVGDKVIRSDNLARMCGLTLEETQACLFELQQAGVFDVSDDGVIFSRRMIRDEDLRNKRATAGKLGGNPNLKVIQKVGDRLTTEVKQKPTPSSSSSSSIKDISIEEAEAFARGQGLPTESIPEWHSHRSSQNWEKTSGVKIANWQSDLKSWIYRNARQAPRQNGTKTKSPEQSKYADHF